MGGFVDDLVIRWLAEGMETLLVGHAALTNDAQFNVMSFHASI